jgi:hypothetical protein
MKTVSLQDAIVTVDGVPLPGFAMDEVEVVPFNSWDDAGQRPTMCEWCRAHPRRYGGDMRCWRCGHEHGCQITGGTARPGEVGKHGFTLMERAICFDEVIPFTGGKRFYLQFGRVM